MRTSDVSWDYELLDCSDGERLERWGDRVLIRPDPQVIWSYPRDKKLWSRADARYIRSSSGGGSWDIYDKSLLDQWKIRYKDMTFTVRPMGFKHTGVFPEQAVNWELLDRVIRSSPRRLSALNLFAYTGCATCACLNAGASCVHVDASKGITAIAKENAASLPGGSEGARFFVDDCFKLVDREIRRGHRYDIVIMDPPSYGRGPTGEVWKIEDEICGLIGRCASLIDDSSVLFMINSYTTGLSVGTMEYMLGETLCRARGGCTCSDEIGILNKHSGRVLPAGGTALWFRDNDLCKTML